MSTAVILLILAVLAVSEYIFLRREGHQRRLDREKLEELHHASPWIRFGDLLQVKSSVRIRNYLRVSRESYKVFGINMENIEIRRDLRQARLNF